MIVYCDCEECAYNDGECCTKDIISMKDTYHADAPAACDDYEEGGA